MTNHIISKKKDFFITCISIILLLIVITSANANEHVYFLIDKSRSMWSHNNPDDKYEKNALDYAKIRVYESLQKNPPEKDGRRNIYLYLFDSELKSYSREIHSIKDAKGVLDPIRPGGKTTIGDRLDDVRLRIKHSGVKSVEIHLLSDMQETVVGKVTKDEAISRLNTDLKGDLKDISLKLIAYTWKTGLKDNEIYAPNIVIEYRPLEKTGIRASIASLDEIVMELIENQGQFEAAKTGQTTIRGFFDIAFHNTPTHFYVEANIAEMPNVQLLLDGLKKLDIGRLSGSTGNLTTRLDIQIQNPEAFMRYSTKPDFLTHKYTVIFKPTLNGIPSNIKKLYTIHYPTSRKCDLTFTTEPYLYIKNYPDGKALYRRNISEGELLKEPIELAWNKGAVGKYVEWSLPKSGNMYGYFTSPNGKDLPSVKLDDSLSRTIIFCLNKVKSISNEFIQLSIRGTSCSKKIPIDIIAQPISLSLNTKNVLSEPLFEKSNRKITDALIIEPSNLAMPHPVDLSLQLSDDCEGPACDGLSAIFINQTNPDISITKNTRSLKIDAPIWFDLKVTSGASGDAQLGLIVKSNDKVISENNQLFRERKFPINLKIRPKGEISVSFAPLQGLDFKIIEENSIFKGLKDQHLTIKGSVSPEFTRQKKKIVLTACIKELNDIPVLLDNQRLLDCTPFINKHTGFIEINKLTVSITGHQIQNLLRTSGHRIINKQYSLLLKPAIKPAPNKQDLQKYTFLIPESVKTTALFQCLPLLEINPGKVDKSIFEGDSLSIPFVLNWNLCLLNKNIIFRIPDKEYAEDIWISHVNKDRLHNYTLNGTFEEHFIMNIQGIKKTINNQYLTLQVQDTNCNTKMPLQINAEKPHIVINAKTEIREILNNDSIEIPDAILLSSNSKEKQYPIKIAIDDCVGDICDHIQFSLHDEQFQDKSISLNGRSLSLKMNNERQFVYKIKSSESGNAKISLNFSSPETIFFNNQQYKNLVKKEIDLNIVIPIIEWTAVLKNSNQRVGIQNSPIPFSTRGLPQTSDDNGINVTATFNADPDSLSDLPLKLQISYSSKKSKPLVKQVYFNETKLDTCTVKQFLKNPHFTLLLDTDQKGTFLSSKGSGKVIITFLPKEYNMNNAVNVYYKVRLDP